MMAVLDDLDDMLSSPLEDFKSELPNAHQPIPLALLHYATVYAGLCVSAILGVLSLSAVLGVIGMGAPQAHFMPTTPPLHVLDDMKPLMVALHAGTWQLQISTANCFRCAPP